MTQAKLTSGDLNGYGGFLGGNDGTMVLEVGPAGAKVTALSVAADGTPTFLKAPISGKVSGEVIQMVISQDAGSSTTSTTSVNLSASFASIVPKSANSKILIRCTFLANIPNLAASNVQAGFQLYDTINLVLIGAGVTFGPISTNGGVGMSANQTIEFFVANAALTFRSFSLRGNTGNASVAFSATQCVWTLTEVQN